MYYGSDFIILLPALLIAAWAQYKVSSTFEKYSQIRSISGFSGAQAARALLDANGLFDVPVEIIGGRLTDHYDPSKRIMRLSEDVFYGTSVAAIGVAAHETGHAVQHQERYSPLIIRNSIAPVASFSSSASWIIIMLGFFFRFSGLIQIGMLLFTAVVFFQIITLPVEFNASSRALKMLSSRGILYEDEIQGAKNVLSAAAMTYVAAALTAILQLVRLFLLSNSRNRD